MSLQEYDKNSYGVDDLLEEHNENTTKVDASESDDIEIKGAVY